MKCRICGEDKDPRLANWANILDKKCLDCKRVEVMGPPAPTPPDPPGPDIPQPEAPEIPTEDQVIGWEAMSPDERQEYHKATEEGYTGTECVVCGKHRHPEDIAFFSDTGPACVDCNYRSTTPGAPDVQAPPPKKQGKRKRKAREDGKIEAIDVSKGAIKVLKELVKGRPELSVYLELGELESKSCSNKMVKTYFYGATLKDMSSLMDFKMNYYERTEKKAISSLKQTIQILEEGGGRQTDVWGPPAPRTPKCKTCGRNSTEDGEGGKCGACVALEADDPEAAPPPKKRGRPKGKGKRKDPDPDDGSSGADPWAPPPRRGRPSKRMEAAAATGQTRLL